MRCPNCQIELYKEAQDLREEVTREMYINRLKTEKNTLKTAGESVSAGGNLVRKNRTYASPDSVEWYQQLAIEYLYQYLKLSLNSELKSEGIAILKDGRR